MAAGNSGDIVVSQTAFYGGMGTDDKIGIKHSFADAESMDIRKQPSRMSVLPGSRKLSDEDLKGLINSMTQTPDGIRWGIATNGRLYKIDNSNDIIEVAVLPNWTPGTFGDLAYWRLTDSIYITGADRIYQYTNVVKSGTSTTHTITGQHSSAPTVAQLLVRDRDGKWVGNNVSRWSANNTYTVPTSISEADAAKCIFLPDQSPMIAIDVYFTAKGTGTVTLTVHNEQNEVVASSTLTSAQVTANARNKFTFNQTEMGEYRNFGTEYHLHLSSSSTGYIARTSVNSNMSGLHFYYFSALLFDTQKKCHPILNWAGSKLLIGNGQYLTDWLPSGLREVSSDEFQRHRVIVENGMEITSLTSNDEYTVLGCEKVGTPGTRPFQQGMLGFWDGFADALNFKIDTPMGEPKSLYTYDNITYCIIDGTLYAYTGAKALTKVRTIMDSQSEFSGVSDRTDVYSHAMTVRRNIMLVAYPSITSLLTMRHGIYSWGSVDKNYPNSWNYSYSIPEATGNYNTDTEKLEIGGIWNFGDTLYFSYSVRNEADDTTEYNIAIVDNESKPARKFSYMSLKYDGGMPWREKQALRIALSCYPMPPGSKLRLQYQMDNNPIVVDSRYLTEGQTEVKMEINKRFKEIKFGFVGEIEGNSMSTPEITSVVANIRDLGEESKVG